jgi:DNA modification methylase
VADKSLSGIKLHASVKNATQVYNGDMKPYSKNPRQISEKRLERLKDTLSRLGDLSGIVHNLTTDEIIGGHQRMKVFEGASEIVVTEKRKKPDDQGTVGSGHILWKGKKYSYRQVRWNAKTAAEANIAANLGAGEWDWDKIANEWDASDLKSWGMDFDELKTWKHDLSGLSELLKSSEEEPVDSEPQIDQAAELNKVWQVKTGDLWKIGEHRLLCGDSTKREDVERMMGGEEITCVFTDPPYGVSIGKKNVMLNTFQPSGRRLENLNMDDMSPKELGDMLLKVFTLWKEYMADNCAVFVCSPQGGGLGMMMMMMMMNAGLEVRHIINWVKNSPTFSMGRLDYDYQHEPILFTWTKTHKRKKEGQFHTSLWAVDKPMANKEHPTMKPVELPVNAFLNHTDEGDIVADMFGGSGTVMIAAEQLKRKCRMIEISPAYCAVILQRMKDSFPEIEITLENKSTMRRKATNKK